MDDETMELITMEQLTLKELSGPARGISRMVHNFWWLITGFKSVLKQRLANTFRGTESYTSIIEATLNTGDRIGSWNHQFPTMNGKPIELLDAEVTSNTHNCQQQISESRGIDTDQ
jgi:hypothetical protein